LSLAATRERETTVRQNFFVSANVRRIRAGLDTREGDVRGTRSVLCEEDAAIAGNGKSCGGRSGVLCAQSIPDIETGSISYMTRTSPGWRKG
jgi:hypothetical protein